MSSYDSYKVLIIAVGVVEPLHYFRIGVGCGKRDQGAQASNLVLAVLHPGFCVRVPVAASRILFCVCRWPRWKCD